MNEEAGRWHVAASEIWRPRAVGSHPVRYIDRKYRVLRSEPIDETP
jgi:hypothetical protein